MWTILGLFCFVTLAYQQDVSSVTEADLVEKREWRADTDAPKSLGGVVRVVLAPRPPGDFSFPHLTDPPKYRGGVLQTTKPPVTLLEHDYNYVQPNQAIVRHIQRVLDRITALRVTVHPRIRRLYELLKKDMLAHYPGGYAGELHSITDLLDLQSTKKPHQPYDPNKLNRVYTTEKDM